MPEPETDFNETLDQVFQLVSRRRWWILLPACLVMVATFAVLSRLPNRYTSEATLLIVQQEVPQRYVLPNSTTDIASALQGIKQEVLSRARLLKINRDYGLYRDASSEWTDEKVFQKMQQDISIQPIVEAQFRGDSNAFRISFVASSPEQARDVTGTLASLFIGQNVKSREEHSVNTTKFLQDQLEEKKIALDRQERILRDFKMRYVGELPEQQQENLGVLTSLQTQLQNTTGALGRAQQQRVYLESLLGISKRQIDSVVPATPASHPPTPLDAAQTDLRKLQSDRAALVIRYTPEHPDVVRLDKEIAQAQAAVNRLEKAAPAAQKAGVPASVASAPSANRDDPAMAQIRSQLEANRVEMENLAKDEKRLTESITQYQDRLNLTPVREQELSGIMRDTELMRQEYAELQKKAEESQLATDLEKSQSGQQFRLIDPPNLPVLPSSPKRLKMGAGGTAFGLFLGFALAFLVDMRDTSFHSEKDLLQSVTPPFVVSIPLLLSPPEQRIRAWMRIVEVVAGCLLVLATVAAGFYVIHYS